MPLQTLTCPSCQAHTWSPGERGKRACPQCRASVTLSWHGVRILRTALERARTEQARYLTCQTCQGQGTILGKPCPICKGHARLRVRQSKERREYTVMREDGTILCSSCGLVTHTLHSIDGQTTKGARGIICDACTVRYSARPIQPKIKTSKRWEKVTPIAHHNTCVQDLAATAAEFYIGSCRAMGVPVDLDHLYMLEGVVRDNTGKVIRTASAGWVHTGSSGWLGAAGMMYDDGTLDAPIFPHPAGCGCARCMSRHEWSPVAEIDRHIYHGPLPLPPQPVQAGIGQFSLHLVSTMFPSHPTITKATEG